MQAYCFVWLVHLFSESRSSSTGWPQNQYLTRDDRELLVLRPPSPKCWAYRHVFLHWFADLSFILLCVCMHVYMCLVELVVLCCFEIIIQGQHFPFPFLAPNSSVYFSQFSFTLMASFCPNCYCMHICICI